MEVEQVADPDAFLERAGALLLADEARRETRGAMRPADPADRALLLDWVEAFATEVLHESVSGDAGRHERSVDARLAGGDAGFALWEADGRTDGLARRLRPADAERDPDRPR